MKTPLRSEAGQVLPLFALFLVVLLGFAALAIDVSRAYADLRFYRSVADAASLAGAQDLQVPNSRAVNPADYPKARQDAMASLRSQLNATGAPTCDLSANVSDCALPGTPYLVSIKTPLPSTPRSCSTCDPLRSVQVTVRNPNYALSFARVFGQDAWNVGVTSVSGLVYGAQYAVVTLRPPNVLPNELDQNREDIDVNGTNTVLNIIRGDIGTNTSAFTNSGGRIVLGSGYTIFHYDDINPDPWNKDLAGNPRGQLLTRLISDPVYTPASRPTAPGSRYSTQAAGVVPCTGQPGFPTDYLTRLSGAVCYRPGIYDDNFNVGTGSGPNVAYLLPGAFFFDRGLDVRGALYGGLISNQQGVVLVVPQGRTFTANNGLVWLNVGSEGCSADGCLATPARDETNRLIASPDGYAISIRIPRDNACFAGDVPRLCSDNGNRTVKLPGGGRLAVAGVIYGPSDQMEIGGSNTTQEGLVGQIIAWTVKYSGNTTLNQNYPGGAGNGVLRVDAACTAPSEPCSP